MPSNRVDTEAIVLAEDIEGALRRAGLREGDALIAHVSLSSLGWVLGGPETVLRSIFSVIGARGTLMMPAQTWKNLDPETGVHWDVPESHWPLIRREWPAFDPAVTPAIGMGSTAEMLRTWPGARRSGHPARSFCAAGPLAEELTADHDLRNIFGRGSPLDKLYRADGRILLLGVGHDKSTALHLAETIADYPGKKTSVEHSAIMRGGRREWVAYETLAVDDSDFVRLGAAYEAETGYRETRLCKGSLRLFRMRPYVDWAVSWMEANRGV